VVPENKESKITVKVVTEIKRDIIANDLTQENARLNVTAIESSLLNELEKPREGFEKAINVATIVNEPNNRLTEKLTETVSKPIEEERAIEKKELIASPKPVKEKEVNQAKDSNTKFNNKSPVVFKTNTPTKAEDDKNIIKDEMIGKTNNIVDQTPPTSGETSPSVEDINDTLAKIVTGRKGMEISSVSTEASSATIEAAVERHSGFETSTSRVQQHHGDQVKKSSAPSHHSVVTNSKQENKTELRKEAEKSDPSTSVMTEVRLLTSTVVQLDNLTVTENKLSRELQSLEIKAKNKLQQMGEEIESPVKLSVFETSKVSQTTNTNNIQKMMDIGNTSESLIEKLGSTNTTKPADNDKLFEKVPGKNEEEARPREGCMKDCTIF
jgi:hypothetical protein